MRSRWIGLSCVAIAALAIVVYKQREATTAGAVIGSPSVLLVADLKEAGSAGDRCAEIMAAVRAARTRGVKVAEFSPDSASPLLKQYHVVSIPTVVIIRKDGREDGRFVGESESMVQALKTRLATMSGN